MHRLQYHTICLPTNTRLTILFTIQKKLSFTPNKARRYHKNGYDMLVYQAENHGKFGINKCLQNIFTSCYNFSELAKQDFMINSTAN
jgi:hypothetical protein